MVEGSGGVAINNATTTTITLTHKKSQEERNEVIAVLK